MKALGIILTLLLLDVFIQDVLEYPRDIQAVIEQTALQCLGIAVYHAFFRGEQDAG
jgi:hypothetical protein